MKKLILSMVLALGAITAQAATIKSAKMNEKKGVIVLEVSYGGGFMDHNFSLKVGACRESFPVQCDAVLVDSGAADGAEAYIQETVEISLEEAGLNESYYTRASLTIIGSDKSEATIRLPEITTESDNGPGFDFGSEPAPAPVLGDVEDVPSVVSPNVESAKLNAKEGVLEVDVSFGGGCLEHTFELQVGGCLESFPVQCTLKVVDTTEGFDACEAFLFKTLKFSLKEYGLTDSYYSGASLTIKGAGKTSAGVTLPRK